MSLLRRRGMMAEKKAEENTIYIYSGYLPASGNMNDAPQYNSLHPNSVCSSAVFFPVNSTLTVTYLNAQSTAGRMYNADGSYRTTFYNWKNQSFSIDCYIRLLANQGAEISSVKISKTDGTEINYKIIDRR